mgnify:CR=1 FL=1
MKFGLLTLMDFHPELQDEATYLADTLSLFELADRLGYSTAWIGEEHFYHFGVCPSPQLMLAALAQRTRSIRLGTAISLLPFENPLRKAEDFALLDVISGGRVNFGVGRGSISKHFEGFGVSARESRARYEEALDVIRRAWTQRTVAHDGAYWTVPELSVSPRPVQRPHPPIWRGTVSEESFLQAAEAGDNAFIIPWVATSEERMGARYRAYRDKAAACGHRDMQSTAVYMLHIDEDHDRALARGREESRRYAELITRYTTRQSSDARFAPGSAAFEHAEYILSISDHLEERAIVGTPETCIRRIREIDEQLGGVTEFAFYLHAGARSTAQAKRSLELFAREVMPAFEAVPA